VTQTSPIRPEVTTDIGAVAHQGLSSWLWAQAPLISPAQSEYIRRVGVETSLELLLAERARRDDPEPPVHAFEVEHVCARQLPHVLLPPVLRQADASLPHSHCFREVSSSG
jgi:hypothetical protein